MAVETSTKEPPGDAEPLRARWLERLDGLVRQIDSWAVELDWVTRRAEKTMRDSRIGSYQAPLLILQKEATRVLLEPIARSTPAGEGLVDLYRMPAYDDIASLYFYDGGWKLHYPTPGSPVVGDIRQTEARPLTKEALRGVLEEMTEHAA